VEKFLEDKNDCLCLDWLLPQRNIFVFRVRPSVHLFPPLKYIIIQMHHGKNHKKHVEAPLKYDLYVGDKGGACRLDGIFHPAICILKGKYGEKSKTKIHLADCKIFKKKVKMERKEIQKTFLQVLRYI